MLAVAGDLSLLEALCLLDEADPSRELPRRLLRDERGMM